MSTYYTLVDDKNMTRGGFFTRQMWGWGNADSIKTLQFLMIAARDYGEIRIVSEYEKDYDSEKYRDLTDKELATVFPRDNIWPDEDPKSNQISLDNFNKLFDLHLMKEKDSSGELDN